MEREAMRRSARYEVRPYVPRERTADEDDLTHKGHFAVFDNVTGRVVHFGVHPTRAGAEAHALRLNRIEQEKDDE